ncbi:unnamed protein product [Ceratitis capitata]|uniref:(Mediterranean fruit fly) hypothetical protein n=1 Tax=Ceratitis capitata TaxID=7213 RepID=A0A811U2V2_CERCA|nr:unnamed protein product [Ceratitis capitata]
MKRPKRDISKTKNVKPKNGALNENKITAQQQTGKTFQQPWWTIKIAIASLLLLLLYVHDGQQLVIALIIVIIIINIINYQERKPAGLALSSFEQLLWKVFFSRCR